MESELSSIKMEEYMESELSGIFRVKLVTKNIVCGSPGTQFMHMRVKRVFRRFAFSLYKAFFFLKLKRILTKIDISR